MQTLKKERKTNPDKNPDTMTDYSFQAHDAEFN